MIRSRHQALAGIVAGALLLGGCKETPKPLPPPPPPKWQVPQSRAAQANELARRTVLLEQSLNELPGNTTEDHRQVMAGALANIAKILRLAEGDNLPPNFSNRLTVVETAQAVLSHPHLPRPRIEALENDSARAVLASIEQIVTDHLSDDTDLPGMIETTRPVLDAMTRSTGAMHDADAAAGFRSLTTLLRRISDDLSAEFAAPTPPINPAVTNPTTGPS